MVLTSGVKIDDEEGTTGEGACGVVVPDADDGDCPLGAPGMSTGGAPCAIVAAGIRACE